MQKRYISVNEEEEEEEEELVLLQQLKKEALEWRKRGLFLQFIPAYCPELNLIEILWKNLKHHCLKVSHYQSIHTLVEAADNILKRYGRDYSISFN